MCTFTSNCRFNPGQRIGIAFSWPSWFSFSVHVPIYTCCSISWHLPFPVLGTQICVYKRSILETWQILCKYDAPCSIAYMCKNLRSALQSREMAANVWADDTAARYVAICCPHWSSFLDNTHLFWSHPHQLFSCTVFVFSYCMFIFLYCFVCQYQSSDWLWRPPPKWPILCRVGR